MPGLVPDCFGLSGPTWTQEISRLCWNRHKKNRHWFGSAEECQDLGEASYEAWEFYSTQIYVLFDDMANNLFFKILFIYF